MMRASTPRAEPLPVWTTPNTGTTAPLYKPEAPDAPAAPAPFHRGTVYEVTGWRYWCVLVPIALLLRLYFATLRIRMTPEDRAVVCDTSRPVVAVLWHNRSLMVPMIGPRLRQPEKMSCLISPSKAAAWEVAFFAFQRIPSVRGSSSRRSIQATREMVKAYRSGQDVWLSPDGPSGPCYEFKRGAAAVARMTKAPILAFGAEARHAWRPKTWDRHFVPLPFSTVRIRGRIFEHAEVFGAVRDDAAAAQFLAARMRELNSDPF